MLLGMNLVWNSKSVTSEFSIKNRSQYDLISVSPANSIVDLHEKIYKLVVYHLGLKQQLGEIRISQIGRQVDHS